MVNIEDQLAEIYRELMDHEAWSHVEKHITGKVDYHKKQLESCPIEDVQSHRDKIRTFESVLYHVKTTAFPPQVDEHP